MNGAKHVFLVDDDDIYIFLMNRMIKKFAFVEQVSTFGNGRKAIEYIEANMTRPELLPDLIFLDLFMPDLDGWEFLRRFSDAAPVINKKISLYVLSSSVSPHDHDRAMSIKAVTDFIIKPVTKETFMSIINSLQEEVKPST